MEVKVPLGEDLHQSIDNLGGAVGVDCVTCKDLVVRCLVAID